MQDMVTWIPSIYPLYVSIYIPAPWILWVWKQISLKIGNTFRLWIQMDHLKGGEE